MTKSRILLFAFIVASTIILYLLPRYVVNNEPEDITQQADESSNRDIAQTQEEHIHSFEIPDSINAKIDSFYESFKNAENQEKRFIFADSLVEAYKTVGKLDSSAKYSEVRAIEIPSLENWLQAGNGYYEMFNFTVDQTRRNEAAEKAREYYIRILEEDPSMLDVKSKLAMTYVASPNPMAGITMLREVVEEDPENELAIYNLGILAITSGQLERALERFQNLIRINPDSPEGNFYMGYCLLETDQEKDAIPFFEKVITLGNNRDLVLASEDYLKRINK